MDRLTRAPSSLAVLSSVFGMLMAGPRVYMQMAHDGVMPSIFKSERGVPRISVVFQALLAMVVVWIAQLEQIIDYLGMTLAACSTLAVAALWRTGKSEPLRWWEHLAATFYIVTTIVMLTCVVVQGQRRHQLWAVIITFALGLVLYVVWKTFSARRASP